ncbi:hypothetical protein FUAX_49910 (plasmid) [Fulvitalea axinellae]|uniref:Sulfatase-modifying factor enzyme-like domain-containing protein n=1 Tax=Fulvitalea axinellae TaxID=1182444 RepID=A0AAU9DDM3_9BACT|nr:hypothetical protein FUAX_49910 [Fulvitalea axinellae]
MTNLTIMILAAFMSLKCVEKDEPPTKKKEEKPQGKYAAMVTVPAGKFTMGCDANIDPVCFYTSNEQLHTVYLDEFQIDKYEVTFKRYQKCVDAGVCTPPAIGGALNYGWPGVDLFPVNGVTWFQAKEFCEWEGKRLPTEAEWEKAARGTDKRTYPWGNESPSCEYAVMDRPNAGFLGCGTGNTLNVGSKPKGASPYGALDMAGNLWEWTADWYDEEYFDKSPKKNPKGPANGDYKVARGGDFFSRAGYELRTTSRFYYEPSDYSIAIGFRCAK